MVNTIVPFSKPFLPYMSKEYLTDAFDSTWVSEGEYISKFENKLRDLLKVKHVLSTTNGTSSLQLAFLALELKPKDEVIIPGYCFQAAANVVLQMNGIPVFVDVENDLSPTNKSILDKVTEKTKCVVLVHNYGYPYTDDIIKLKSELHKRSVYLIEDCAEAIFSKIGDSFCGTFGDIGTFSFHATKTITTGEGGMFITNDKHLYDKAKLIRSHGLLIRGTYDHILPGNNFRMSNLHAAVGLGQLDYLGPIIYSKEESKNLYIKLLSNETGIELIPVYDNYLPIVWSFPVILSGKNFSQSEIIVEKLKEFGIYTRPGFTPPSKLVYYKNVELENCDFLHEHIIVLPMYVGIQSSDIEYVCETLLNFRS